MERSGQRILVCGLLSGLIGQAGLLTSASADAYGPDGTVYPCDTGLTSGNRAACSASAGIKASASAVGTASFGLVSALVSGGAAGYGYESSAIATASFTDIFTFYGGTGAGSVTLTETILRSGTGSLDVGAVGLYPEQITITQSFTYGTPFSVTLSAYASGNFFGALCDGGSLFEQKSLDSLTVSGAGATYTDASGHLYNTGGTAVFTTTPEPSGWVLGVIGLILIVLAKRSGSARKAS